VIIPTRAQANERLSLWKLGSIELTEAEINACLYATGDLE
jgi:hypothetical protein